MKDAGARSFSQVAAEAVLVEGTVLASPRRAQAPRGRRAARPGSGERTGSGGRAVTATRRVSPVMVRDVSGATGLDAAARLRGYAP